MNSKNSTKSHKGLRDALVQSRQGSSNRTRVGETESYMSPDDSLYGPSNTMDIGSDISHLPRKIPLSGKGYGKKKTGKSS